MLLARIAAASAALSATRSRLAKRDILAGVLTEAETDEIELAVAYLSGSLRQRRTGVGWAALVDLPPPAAAPALTLPEVDADFDRIAAIAGGGSAATRTAAVAALFVRATSTEQDLLRGLVSGELRQGALDAQVQDGLAQACGVPLPLVQRGAMLLGSTAAAARLLREGGSDALAAVGLQVGVPVRPMLAASAPDPAAAAQRSGLPAVVDAKLDGIRVQVHRRGTEIVVFTRSLDEITARLPEVVDTVAELDVDTLVVDGEVVGLDPAGRPLPFQVISSRTATSADIDTARRATPLSLFCFDLLHLDGVDLLDQPLSHRIEEMTRALPAGLIVPRTHAETVVQLTAAFAEAIENGWEGVVVKDLDAGYAAGRRDAGWVKVKPRHTFDLAVTAAEWGHGRREGWLSNLHLAARDPATGGLVMLGKTFKGLTDALLASQTEQMLARESRRTRGTVFIDPPLVVEIACDGVQRSVRYPGGVALRFARVLRYRDDKNLDEIDSLQAVIDLGGLHSG